MMLSWTSEQDRILREVYPTTKSEDLVSLLGKTVKQMHRRVCYLGLSKTASFISEQKRRIGTKNRTCRLCSRKHMADGLCGNHYALVRRGTITEDGVGHVVKKVKWTADEDALLIQRYPLCIRSELLAFFPGKKLAAIQARSAVLGLKKSVETKKRCHQTKMTLESRIKRSCTYHGITLDQFEGFSSTFNQRIRQTDQYACWREAVYRRDSYTCQHCQSPGSGDLHGHHIVPLSKLIDQYDKPLDAENAKDSYFYDVSNGVTLCDECHSDTHDNVGLVKALKHNTRVKRNRNKSS